jgi:hypothetical protein
MNKPTMSLMMAMIVVSGVANADEAAVKALENKCEEAREVLLKPLREAEIARCKSKPESDPAYCERYWRNYGNATLISNGTMGPRMFFDLPECVAAEEARHKLRFLEEG